MTRLLTRAADPTLTLALALTVAACGQETGETTPPEMTESEFAFGFPADAADADRVIEIQTTDALNFESADITVGPETVTFRLTSDGALVSHAKLRPRSEVDIGSCRQWKETNTPTGIDRNENSGWYARRVPRWSCFPAAGTRLYISPER